MVFLVFRKVSTHECLFWCYDCMKSLNEKDNLLFQVSWLTDSASHSVDSLIPDSRDTVGGQIKKNGVCGFSPKYLHT